MKCPRSTNCNPYLTLKILRSLLSPRVEIAKKKITEFFNENMLFNLENFIDPRGNLAIQLGILGLPGSILISPDGHELARLIGPINWVEPNVVKFFKNLTQ